MGNVQAQCLDYGLTLLKIKKVNTKKIEEDKETSLEKSDIQNLKQFLIEEYEVNEKCLEIN